MYYTPLDCDAEFKWCYIVFNTKNPLYERRCLHAVLRRWTHAQWQLQTLTIVLHISAKCNTVSRTLQMSKPAGNTTWTMEIDPTNVLLLSLTSANALQITMHHTVTSSEQYNSVPATLCRRLQPTMSNGCASLITADHRTSQTLCPPLPSSMRFDNYSDGENLLKPTLSLASCDMTLSVSTKQIKGVSDGLCKAAIVSESQVLWWWFAWTIWPPSRFRVRHGTQILQRIRDWNEFELVVWNARKDKTHHRQSSQQLH